MKHFGRDISFGENERKITFVERIGPAIMKILEGDDPSVQMDQAAADEVENDFPINDERNLR